MRGKKKRALKRKNLSRECWSLDYSILVWLQEHLKVFLKDASKIVNLSYHKFTYKEQEYTQEELLRLLIHKIDALLPHYGWWEGNWHAEAKEVWEIWTIIFPYMWW